MTAKAGCAIKYKEVYMYFFVIIKVGKVLTQIYLERKKIALTIKGPIFSQQIVYLTTKLNVATQEGKSPIFPK